jgi:hypothetical protein
LQSGLQQSTPADLDALARSKPMSHERMQQIASVLQDLEEAELEGE